MNAANNKQVKLKEPLTGKGAAETKSMLIEWAKERMVTLILTAVMMVGVCLLAYPSFSDYWNSLHQQKAVMSYAEAVANMNEDEYNAIFESAKAYNEKITREGIDWTVSAEKRAVYDKELNLGGTGIMGYIKIQKINIMLPIYHGTDEDIL
jgi:sortase A